MGDIDLTELTIFLNKIREHQNLPDSEFEVKFSALLDRENDNLNLKHELQNVFDQILSHVNFVNALTDYGITSNRGFFQEIYTSLKHKFIPEKLELNELRYFIQQNQWISSHKNILRKLSVSNWIHLQNYASLKIDGAENRAALNKQLFQALIILSHRLATIAVDPYFTRRQPEIDAVESPFFQFNLIISAIPADRNNKVHLTREEYDKSNHFLQGCMGILESMELHERENGTSLHLIFLTKLAKQQIGRIRLILDALSERDCEAHAKLVRRIAQSADDSGKLQNFFKNNTQLLAHRVVNHTSEKGEHYIGFTRNENKKLFISALGGGLVVVLLVMIKQIIHQFQLSLFAEGLLFGLNYAAGFITMHLLHFTLATKQPAMTASYMASSILRDRENPDKSKQAFKQILGSQFISLIGNLMVVLPVTFMIGWAMIEFLDFQFFTSEDSRKALYSNHPIYSGSLIYACFTAIFLSLSGIITGLVDNKLQFAEIPFRIIHHPALVQRLSLTKREKLAKFVEKHGGAILGNLFLGLCLGMAGNIGEFLGIPFDIRHITISAGNFGFALSSGFYNGISLLLTVFTGIILIGLINIVGSFLISFALACKSQGVSWKVGIRILLRAFYSKN